jgi:Zn finger protein HypA/HybF involved in hydrogenase expression
MIAEITAGLSGLKSASDIIKTLQTTATQATVNEVKIGLQQHIMEAQTALFAAQQAETASAGRIRDLEQQIVEMKDWSREAERYQLQAIDRGCLAYVPKSGMENGEPPHWLCASCFNRRHKSFLQFKGRDQDRPGHRADTSNYGCDTCKATLKVHYGRKPSEPYSGPA